MRKTKWTKEILEVAVKDSFSIATVLFKLGLKPTGGNYSHISKKLRNYGIDTSHFTGQGHLKGKSHNWTTKIPLDNILIENSTYQRGSLKRRLLKEARIKNICHLCGMLPNWNGKPLVLQLDHINGIWNDNRFDNLRLLCPNCHSQTKTFANRKRISGAGGT
jgi:hypothetical protein